MTAGRERPGRSQQVERDWQKRAGRETSGREQVERDR